MEEFFSYWIQNVGRTLGRYLIFASLAFIIFYIILKKPLWFRKIQKRMPRINDYTRDFLWSVSTVCIFATVAYCTFRVFAPYTHFYSDISEYGWGYYIFTWVWMFFMHDTWFYWAHRLMHHPLLFKHVHLIHHKSTNPSPWTAYAFHPIEAFLEVMIVPILAFSIPIHKASLGTFFLFQIIYNVYGHLGFELYPKGFHKTWIGRWVNTSVAHNLHHKRFKGNYSLYFLFWDRLMGTLRTEYDEVYEKSTTKTADNIDPGVHGRLIRKPKTKVLNS